EAGHDPRADVHTHRSRVLGAMSRTDVDVLLAEVGPEPVGVLVLRRGELLPLTDADAVHVEQLYVRPQWRRRGAARALLMAAAALGDEAGLERLACSAAAGDRETARFLTRLGFAPLVTQRVVPVPALLRRLGGESPAMRRRSAIDQVLAKRRRQQARSDQGAGPVPQPDRTARVGRVFPSVTPRIP
ncbi:MAG: GNAT family N-acetyltransferase, partial [Actinomycetes bacterium]